MKFTLFVPITGKFCNHVRPKRKYSPLKKFLKTICIYRFEESEGRNRPEEFQFTVTNRKWHFAQRNFTFMSLKWLCCSKIYLPKFHVKNRIFCKILEQLQLLQLGKKIKWLNGRNHGVCSEYHKDSNDKNHAFTNPSSELQTRKPIIYR